MRSFSFSGVAINQLRCPDSPSLALGAGKDMSVGAWVAMRHVSAGGDDFVGQYSSSGNRSWLLGYDGPGNRFLMRGSADGTALTQCFTAASFDYSVRSHWYFLLGWYDGTNLSISVNNRAPSTQAHAGGLFDSTGDLSIGNTGNGVFCQGDIGTVFLYI